MYAGRIMGIDPGLSRCGVAVVDGPGHRPVVVRAEVVRTEPDADHGLRLRALHEAFEAVLAADRPGGLAVERVFLNSQARTGVGAIQVMGLVHLLGATHGLPVVEYTPSQVKAAVTGVGDAEKSQVGYMVARMLRLAEVPKPADVADALAVALCHLHQPKHSQAGQQLSPRLAAALADAKPGLQAVTNR